MAIKKRRPTSDAKAVTRSRTTTKPKAKTTTKAKTKKVMRRRKSSDDTSPDYIIKVKSLNRDRHDAHVVGVGWLKEDGSIRLSLNSSVLLDGRSIGTGGDDRLEGKTQLLTLWPAD